MKNLNHKLITWLVMPLTLCVQTAFADNKLNLAADITISAGYIMQDGKYPSKFSAYAEERKDNGDIYYIKTNIDFIGSGFLISNSLTDNRIYAQLGQSSQKNIVKAIDEFHKTSRDVILKKFANVNNKYYGAVNFSIDDQHQLNSKLTINSDENTFADTYSGGFLDSIYFFSLNTNNYLAVTIVYCGASACSSELKVYSLK